MSRSNPLLWPKPPVIWVYGIAVLSVTAALIISRLPAFHLEAAPVSLFLCAIMFTAWFGGAGPGLLATALSTLAFHYYFLPPMHSLAPKAAEIPRIVIFTVSALIVGLLSAAQRSATESLRRARDDLQGTVQELQRTNEMLQAESRERKHAENELRRSDAYLSEAQRLSHTGSFGWRISTGDIIWSEETFRIFQYDPTTKPTVELILQRVHPEDAALVKQTIERASKDGKDFDFEHRLLMPDGSVKYVRVVAHPPAEDNSSSFEFVGAVTDITERKQGEEALRRSESYLAEAQRLTHAGSWAWRVAGRDTVHLSEEWYRIYGFDPEKGMPAWEKRLQRVHPADRGKWQGTIDQAIREKSDYDMEFRILLPGGTVKYIHTVGHPVLNASGDLVQFVGSAMDITERKRAEEALRRSEGNLAEAQKLTRSGSWAWDVRTRDVFWSQEMFRIFDYDPEKMKPTLLHFLERVYPEDRSSVEQRAKLESTQKERMDSEGDYRIVLPDGTIKHLHSIAHPVMNESGEIIEVVGTTMDVTERKRAEEKIRQSERELRQLLDLTPLHITEFGPDGNPLYNNQAALDYHGLTLEEWRSADLHGLLHPQDAERMTSEGPSKFRSGSPHELEARLRRRDGQYRWFLFRFNPILDEQGRLTRWYAAATDIEDRKQAEERLQHENVALREEIDKASMFEEIVGTSPALQPVLSRVSKVAPTDSTVLITGETGTGKELVARAIHRRSQRSSRAFVSVNCAAIPRDLIASELFGHEKGAFTGATQRRLGRFELAEGGTIFLDEVGELPAETQIALLRVLQEHEFERVGGTRSIQTNVRVIAATNRDLQAAIPAGSFRSDLFYRLNVFPIEMPPLRERREDIPLLVEYFIDRYAKKEGKKIRAVGKSTMELLLSYPWPGNIRELQNVIERSVIVCETENFSIDESWLSRQPVAAQPKSAPDLSEKLAAQEKEIIEAALAKTGGRVSGPSGAATMLGVRASTLESKIRSMKINKFRFRTT